MKMKLDEIKQWLNITDQSMMCPNSSAARISLETWVVDSVTESYRHNHGDAAPSYYYDAFLGCKGVKLVHTSLVSLMRRSSNLSEGLRSDKVASCSQDMLTLMNKSELNYTIT